MNHNEAMSIKPKNNVYIPAENKIRVKDFSFEYKDNLSLYKNKPTITNDNKTGRIRTIKHKLFSNAKKIIIFKGIEIMERNLSP